MTWQLLWSLGSCLLHWPQPLPWHPSSLHQCLLTYNLLFLPEWPISSLVQSLHLSTIKSEIADRRQTGQPTDDDMVVAEQLQGPAVSAAAPLPYMRFRLRDKLQYWKQIGASKMVLGWVEHGFMGTFWAEPPKLQKKNQQSIPSPFQRP